MPIYDTLDAHLGASGDLALAVVPMGLFLAWAVNLRLFADAEYLEHESLLLRIRFREARGSELLVICGGNLREDMFTPEGRRFMDAYYPQYMNDYSALFGGQIYAAKEDWVSYDRLAPLLTRAFMEAPSSTAKTPWANLGDRVRTRWGRLWR